MLNPTTEAFKKLKAFKELVSATTKALQAAQTPSTLVTAIDERIQEWEVADAEFAGVLKDLRGQAFGMTMPHIRAVTTKLCDHLKINLARIEKGLDL